MIQLLPMTESDFADYCQNAAEEYANEKIASGNWHSSEALERAKKEFNNLLIDGLKTENHFLFSLQDEVSGNKIGMIWFMLEPKRPIPVAFIFDFIIYVSFRNKGFGLKALLKTEAKAFDMGARRMELHVFEHNKAAQALYEKAGYQITNLNMAKQLGQSDLPHSSSK